MAVANALIQIETSMGEIVLELNREKAPLSVENFLKYAKAGHYDGTIFHRVIKGFMVQGGGMTADMEEKPTHAAIVNEARNGLKNREGTVAMARTAEIDSATAQFFFNTENNKFLNYSGNNSNDFGYAVFGEVIEGMDIVYSMEQQATGTVKGHDDVPLEPIVIESMTVIE